MSFDSKPFRQKYGAEYLYLFDGMWQREDQLENPDQFETIVLGFINYLGTSLQQNGISPRKLRIPPFPNFSFQISLTQESVLLILGQSASTSIRFAYYKNYSQLALKPTLGSVLTECEQNYGWDNCLGVSFTNTILTNRSLREEELRKEANIFAEQFAAQNIQKKVDHNNLINQLLEPKEPNLKNKREISGIQHYTYDVALSFAGEDRLFAEELFEALCLRSIKAFYDEYEKSTLWGKNLYTYLSDVYQKKARYCVMLLSNHYAAKLWTNHEREAAQARAFMENEEYILPVRLDDTQIPGVLSTTAYLSWHKEKAEGIAEALLNKLRSQKTNQTHPTQGNDYCSIRRHEEALIAYDHAIHLDPTNASAYNNKSWALNCLERFEEALIACEQALLFDPNLSAAQSNKSIALKGLGKSEEA